MNIKSRIVSRRAVFFLIYQSLFINKDFSEVGSTVTNFPFCHYDKSEIEQSCMYLYENFLSYNKEPIEFDWDFLFELKNITSDIVVKTKTLVDNAAITFGFDKMDMIDKSIFILAVSEHSIFGTPKEVIINEMVEIAKRYGDDRSPKLINGILNNILI